MDVTLGSSEALDNKVITQILAVARQAIKADTEQALAGARSETAAALAAHSATAAELEAEQAKRIEAEIKAQNTLSENLAASQRQTERFHDFAATIGRAAKRVFLWGTAPILLLCGYVSLPSSAVSASHPLWRYVVSILLLLGAVSSFAGAFFGASIMGIARQIEVRTTEKVERFLVSRFGV